MKQAAIAGVGVAALAGIAYNYQSGEDTELFMSHRMRQADYDYMRFVSNWGKSYGTKAEYVFRQKIFEKKDKELQEINSDPTNTFTVDHNKFSDWTAEEYGRLLGYRADDKLELDAPHLPVDFADEVDWRTKGAVTKVKNQEQCGSCWAFSSTGAIEGREFIAGAGPLTSLSEQQLVDCSKANHGCQGGLMETAFRYIVENPLETEATYPYVSGHGKKETCKYEKSRASISGHVTGYKDVQRDSAEQLKAAVAQGPTSIAVEADKSVFQHYRSGVINSRSCGKKLDHGVLAVGYGSEGGEGYFIVKNSWGPTWGDAGYLKISDGAENVCGILSQPCYPTE